MYTLLKNAGVKAFVINETPSLGLSLILAEEFYKFGSFTLECSAFLATWYASSFVFHKFLMKKFW
jgi:hypothetical protein